VFASQHSACPSPRSRGRPRRPSRVVGMHFFSPVHKMPLLEVIVTPSTDAESTATAVTFGRRHRQARDRGPRRAGFYTSRAPRPLHERGGPACSRRVLPSRTWTRRWSPSASRWGRSSCSTRSGSTSGAKVAKVHARRVRRAHGAARLHGRVLSDGRLGRKNKRGFYTYDGAAKQVDAERLPASLGRLAAAEPGRARHPGPAGLRVPERGRALPAGGHPALAARRRHRGHLRPRIPSVSWAGRSATSITWRPLLVGDAGSWLSVLSASGFRPPTLLVEMARRARASMSEPPQIGGACGSRAPPRGRAAGTPRRPRGPGQEHATARCCSAPTRLAGPYVVVSRFGQAPRQAPHPGELPILAQAQRPTRA
jgi:hypothetical protein